MIRIGTTRWLLSSIPLIFLLMSGCLFAELHDKTPPCFNPGAVAKKKNCFYVLEVVDPVPVSEGVYRVIVPDEVLIHNGKHSSYTRYAGLIGAKLNQEHYARVEYEIKVSNPRNIAVTRGIKYEFRSIKGETTMELMDKAKPLPEDQGEFQGTDPDKNPGGVSKNDIGTELYASHSPQCCMCGSCSSGCYCPGQAGCPWCAAADVETLLANAPRIDDSVDLRYAYGPSKMRVAQTFLRLLNGRRASGNISAKAFAAYQYDPNFAPKCLTKGI